MATVKDKPLLKLIFLMPILGIGGIPLWNGYISKTLIHESMVEYIEVLKEAGQSIAFMKGAEILFLFSGGLTLAYMTKIFVCIFLEDNPYGAPKPVKNGPYISKLMAVILGAIAICLPILGIFPHQTQDALAAMGAHFMNAHTPAHAVHYFAWVKPQGCGDFHLCGHCGVFLVHPQGADAEGCKRQSGLCGSLAGMVQPGG